MEVQIMSYLCHKFTWYSQPLLYQLLRTVCSFSECLGSTVCTEWHTHMLWCLQAACSSASPFSQITSHSSFGSCLNYLCLITALNLNHANGSPHGTNLHRAWLWTGTSISVPRQACEWHHSIKWQVHLALGWLFGCIWFGCTWFW